MTPSSRSKQMLEKDGWLVAVVEKFVRFPPPGHRVDLFGMFDLLAVRGNCVMGVQVTSGSNVSARLTKMRQNPALKVWTASPHRLAVVHGWAKRGGKGERKTWQCREVTVEPTTQTEEK